VSIDVNAFNYVRQLVRERSAIVLEDDKRYLVDSRLSLLARREGLASAQEVIDRLRATPGGPLQNTILPELQRLRTIERKLQIWSCACSSGQEPYSLAMLVREHFPALVSWNVQLIATDISTEMLARSRAGVYSQLEVKRGLPGALLLKYFEKLGLEWQIRPELRKMIDFRELNLAGPWNGVPLTDLVMLRNVLIYFDIDTKRQILGRIRKLLRPGGFLMLGTAETTMNLDDGFELIRTDGTSYYRVRSA